MFRSEIELSLAFDEYSIKSTVANKDDAVLRQINQISSV